MTEKNDVETTVATESALSTRKTVSSRSKKTTTTAANTVSFPVEPKFATPAMSALAVNNRLKGPVKSKIASECYVIADFDPTWAFAHQNGITYFKGKYYAGWSSGLVHEDAPGQRGMAAYSADGKTWSEPQVIAVPEQGTFGQKSLLFAQFVTTDEMLYAFFIEHEYGKSCFNEDGSFKGDGKLEYLASRSMMVCTKDGVNWTEPIQYGGNSNESPRQSLTGRWFSGAGQGLNIWNDSLTSCCWSYLSNEQVQDARLRGAELLTEASWYQTDDYVIHLMLRSNAGYIWMSESYDNGETWTDAYPTQFTSESTMANFGRLPDGRFYFVGSIEKTSRCIRYPLELYVSEDGYNFNKGYILRDEKYEMQQDGWAKGGYFAYPEVFIHDGYMNIIYSKQKEVIELTRVKLSDI